MYTRFRSLLERATGQSELVIVANADIRGFSRFSLERESVETALFVKKVYMAMLSDYFDYVDFYKPTGDGLLMVFRVDEASLTERANRLVEDSLRLVRDFKQLLAADEVINFPVPGKIGIGLARGAASKLVSGRKTLDYSGKVLNLASRLMDFARPAGIVLDESFGFRLLDRRLGRTFARDAIYVRSVAEARPVNVFYTKRFTEIPSLAHRPIHELEWEKQVLEYRAKQIQELDTTRFMVQLSRRPVDQDQIEVNAWYPDVTRSGAAHPRTRVKVPVDFVYEEEMGEPHVVWNADQLALHLQLKGVKSTWPVRVVVSYPT